MLCEITLAGDGMELEILVWLLNSLGGELGFYFLVLALAHYLVSLFQDLILRSPIGTN